MKVKTSVFQSGNSQAVRLPKAFRFTSRTVEIYRRGDEVVLRESAPNLKQALAALPRLPAELAGAFDDIRDTRPPQERDWAVREASATAKSRRRRSICSTPTPAAC
jgi:antitoxin VapB